jgi:hypothetical protein
MHSGSPDLKKKKNRRPCSSNPTLFI